MDMYHVCNRGVEKRDVVLDDGDRARFVHDLYAMNDSDAVPNYILHARKNAVPAEHARNLLVHIHAWSLMPNHYHLLVSPVEDDPKKLSLFAQKFGMGYSKFFNEKYERTGALWQGKYRKVLVTRDAHFLYLPFYIHLNPLDLSMPEWRQGGVKSAGKALTKLFEYRWSSLLDYSGVPNFPSVIDKSILSDVLGSRARQEKIIADIISNPSISTSSEFIEM